MQKKYIPVAVFFVALLLLLATLGARITAVPTFSFAAGKVVYLTFDDGPSTVVTGRILDTLKKENIKATFFVVGDRVEGREDTLRRIAREGHTIGVHSQTHVYSQIYASDKALLADVDKCAETVRRVTGISPRVYRFPGGGGKNKEQQTTLLRKRGYRVVGWNAVCGDEEIPGASADRLYNTTVSTSKGKSRVILLLHDSAARKNTAEALPRIIEYFRQEGYEFCAF